MKTNLLLLITCIAFFNLSEAQTPIQNFDSTPFSKYFVVSSPSAVDHSPSGANATWNFNSFSVTGTTIEDTYALPTPTELLEYPNTTSVRTSTPTPIGGGVSQVFTEKTVLDLVSITGIKRQSLSLNYDGDNSMITGASDTNGNGVVGTFPLAFSASSSDEVSGNFEFDSPETGLLTGTFWGTFVATVDAYGTLNTNDLGSGIGAYSGAVTRLKIEQNVDFNILNASASQLSYYYYDAATGNIILRYTEFIITTTGSLFDTIEDVLIERLDTTPLSNNENIFSGSTFDIYPNPVKNELHFNLKNNTKIKSFIVSDITGRQVLNATTNTNSFDVSQLKRGAYVVSVETNRGTVSRKFIKE